MKRLWGALSGIVSGNNNGRLFARHELYVRHILENLTPAPALFDAIYCLLKTYVKYDTPIIRYTSRQDGLLFKFLLNHDFIFENARRYRSHEIGADLYSAFEIDFQLDGHYWLQYGQYMNRIGQDEAALDLLNKSIKAYPDNDYAAHALADIKLKIARNRPMYDARAKSLIGEAIAALNIQDARRESRTDQYPLVTLAIGHISCLLAHGQIADARSIAPDYYNRLTVLEKISATSTVANARERMLMFATTGEWTLQVGDKSKRDSGTNGKGVKRLARRQRGKIMLS